MRLGDQQYVTGILRVAAKHNPSVAGTGSKSSDDALHSLITSPRLIPVNLFPIQHIQNQGNDITPAMSAIQRLRKICSLQSWARSLSI